MWNLRRLFASKSQTLHRIAYPNIIWALSLSAGKFRKRLFPALSAGALASRWRSTAPWSTPSWPQWGSLTTSRSPRSSVTLQLGQSHPKSLKSKSRVAPFFKLPTLHIPSPSILGFTYSTASLIWRFGHQTNSCWRIKSDVFTSFRACVTHTSESQKMLLGPIVLHPSYNQICRAHLFYYQCYLNYKVTWNKIHFKAWNITFWSNLKGTSSYSSYTWYLFGTTLVQYVLLTTRTSSF